MEHKLKLCMEYIRVIQRPYIADCDVRHRNCDGLNEECPDYEPIGNRTEEPVRQGSLAFLIQTIKQ